MSYNACFHKNSVRSDLHLCLSSFSKNFIKALLPILWLSKLYVCTTKVIHNASILVLTIAIHHVYVIRDTTSLKTFYSM